MADINKLEADVKELKRLHGILDEYASSEIKRLSGEILEAKNMVRNLERKVQEVEKKVKK
jgi:hypothetical protein